MPTNGRARTCRCPRPQRLLDADGVSYCGLCEELLPDPSEAALPLLIRHIARLERQIGELHAELIGGRP
jgi:hypothetical protein